MHRLPEINEFLSWLEANGRPQNTVLAYGRDLKKFDRFLDSRNVTLSAVSREHVEDFMRELLEHGLSARSVARHLASLHFFFVMLRQDGRIPTLPTAEVPKPKFEYKAPRYLEVSETKAMLAVPDIQKPLGMRDAVLLAVLYGSGLRATELVTMRFRDLDLGRGLVRVLGKGRKERLVPMSRKAVEAGQVWLDRGRPALASDRSEDFVFLNCHGGPLSRVGLHKIVKRHATIAGIPRRVSAHILRHSFATHLLDGGAGVRAIQLMLGHSSVTTTQHYAVATEANLAQTMTLHPRWKVKR